MTPTSFRSDAHPAMPIVPRAATSTRRLVLLSSATLTLLACVCDVARAQGETAAALARPVDFDSNVIASTIRANLSRLRVVYESHLRSNPQLSGRINLEFRVSYGLVIDDVVVTENTTGDEAFGKEIGAALLAFDWPSTPLLGGSVRFSYPFVFAPEQR